MTIKEASGKLREKKTTCAELVSSCLKAVDEREGEVHAYLEIFSDAMELAEREDARITAGDEVKPLSGIPLAMKDVILIKGKRAGAGSKILENYHAPYDATVVQKLRQAGAIFIGRTNMDEFAMGSSTENSAYGPTLNPHDTTRVPGGSSGGSAAAVAMGGAVAALGSDTGGSIRQPAALCGVVGLKPTYGAVSRYGLIAMASSLDQIGPITKTVEDAEIVFNVIKGKDPLDSTSVQAKSASEIRDKFRIGLLKYDSLGVSKEVNDAMAETVLTLKSLGHTVSEVELPYLEYSLPCYYIIMPAEASTNLARYDGVKYGFSSRSDTVLENYRETRGIGFGLEVRRRIMLGTYVLSSGYYDEYYGRAQKVRSLIKNDFEGAFSSYDLILSPTAPTQAFKVGEKWGNPLEMYLSDIFTVSANIAGVPAISVPARQSGKNSLPIGVQFLAPWFKEEMLFKIGKEYENAPRA